ncbi:MAG TPA: AraC family transcriptional regulator [Ensifer sp.]|nr:AraC family transcriptional regulator [Ensifer sp.]
MDTTPVVEDVCQIIIHDCRRNRPVIEENFFQAGNACQANIALIEPERFSRDAAFGAGFADFVSWPVLAGELYVRVLGQCRSLSLDDTHFRYSSVPLVERCCVHLTRNLAQDVSVAALARMFNTNHTTLTTLFNREMGLPPIAWQRKMRLEGAARQLTTSNAPITTIAERFGYELPANFATAFHRHFGMTPRHYRRLSRAKLKLNVAEE